jgi:hypothetical protein
MQILFYTYKLENNTLNSVLDCDSNNNITNGAVIFGERYGLVNLIYIVVHCLHCSSVLYHIVRVWLVYILWLFYIVRVYSIFQAEFFGDIFVFLLQILAEFFIITSEISRPDGIDKTIYRKQFGNFRRCAGFNLTKEPVRRKSEPSTLYNRINLLSTAYGDYCSSRRQKA